MVTNADQWKWRRGVVPGVLGLPLCCPPPAAYTLTIRRLYNHYTPTTYWRRCSQHADQVPTNNPTTSPTQYRPHTDHVTDPVPTTYGPRHRPSTDHIPTTSPTQYRPHTDHPPLIAITAPNKGAVRGGCQLWRRHSWRRFHVGVSLRTCCASSRDGWWEGKSTTNEKRIHCKQHIRSRCTYESLYRESAQSSALPWPQAVALACIWELIRNLWCPSVGFGFHLAICGTRRCRSVITRVITTREFFNHEHN